MPATDRHLYVCGPNGFMEHVLGTARALGWAEAQLHREYFAGAAVPASEAGGFEVQLASSGRCLQVPAHRSVAQVLLEAGIDIPLSCEQGICGTCITRVLEGEPEHRDMFLTDAERARNDQFTPCCSRARSARLVLDL
jgi:vanillate O-demethylase ferredoxin subunit